MSVALLEKACTNCKPSSIKTYWANIKALAKIAGREKVPSGAAWLSDALLKRVEAMPLNRFKRFATRASRRYRCTRRSVRTGARRPPKRASGTRRYGRAARGGGELAAGRVQGARHTGEGAAHGAAAPREEEDLDEQRPVPLPAVFNCVVL